MRKLISTLLSVYLAFTLLAQDTSPSNDIGGGFEENLFEDEYYEDENEDASSEELVESSLWDINDSIRFIPAYDVYCKWDTRNIHSYDYDLTNKKDTSLLVLRHSDCDFHIPCGGHVTSDFGMRGSRYHYGIDLKLYKGDPVKSCFEGTVRISQYSKSYGHVVVIRHNNGLETLYAHLSKRNVEPGDHIEAGEVLGLGGNTGRSSGAHLHFECRYKGEPINPRDVINFDEGSLLASTLEVSSKNFDYLKAARSKKYYKVKSGDTLYAIARKHQTSVKTLCKLNGIRENGVIRIGQTLRYR